MPSGAFYVPASPWSEIDSKIDAAPARELVLASLRTRAPAEMLPKNTETLKNMNSTTAKFAKWYVRVIDPKVIQYSFAARNEKVGAEKFQCELVSNAPSQYMLGWCQSPSKPKAARGTP